MPLPFATPIERLHTGGDQARALRSLVASRSDVVNERSPTTRRCHTIVIAGGKGGVGRSVIALNLAVVLAQRGESVGLLDACPDFGSLEFLCGLNGYWNLSHVMEGCRQLTDVIQVGPAGVKMVSGASSLMNLRSGISQKSFALVNQLDAFERHLDWMIVDASGGSSESGRCFIEAADDLLIVAAPEPTSVAEAYASVKSYATVKSLKLGLVVNQVDSAAQAQKILDNLQQAAHSFLQIDLHRRGAIPRDAAVSASVNERRPFVLGSPESPSAAAIGQLAKRWTRRQSRSGVESYFNRFQMCADRYFSEKHRRN